MKTILYVLLGIIGLTLLCLFIIAAIKDSKRAINELNDHIRKNKQPHPHHNKTV